MSSSLTAPNWTAALAALPARERLEWTRTINADVEALAKAPPQPAFSRAYASAVHGSAGKKVSLLDRSSVGGHLSAVTRDFPSSDSLVARMLAEAIDKAGAKPDMPFVAPDEGREEQISTGPVVGGGAAADAGALVDAGILAAVQAAQLGAAYRPTIAKTLQRRLANDAAWAAEASIAPADGAAAQPAATPAGSRFPHAAALARGEVTRAVVAAWEDAQELRAAMLASEGEEGGGAASQRGGAVPSAAAPGDVSSGSAPAPAAALGDDLLDAALDELMG